MMRAERRRSSSFAICFSSSICSFFASSNSEFSLMSPNSRATRMRSATSRRLSVDSDCKFLLQLLVALLSEQDVSLHDASIGPGGQVAAGKTSSGRTKHMRLDGARLQRTLGCTVQSTALPTRHDRALVAVPDRRRSRSARASCSRRWPACPCRPSAARAGASARASCARRWSRPAGSRTATSARSATCASPATSTRSPCRCSARIPATVAEAARMCEAAGADIIDINFGCPVKQGHEDRRRRIRARQPRHRDRRHEARVAERRLGARHRQAAPRRAQRLARLPRARPQARRGRRARRSRCTRARRSRCTPASPTTA